jgi:hypothetical protein
LVFVGGGRRYAGSVVGVLSVTCGVTKRTKA